MRKPIRVVLAIACLACCAAASAQVPTFTPYGAWRGRIRYVEGPWRTRSTIHWGNGVTPTGGQVIMHGLTAAESVLTNPDFLSKVTGLRDAQAAAKAEAANSQLKAALEDIRTRNQTIAELNESVLKAWGLEATKLESLAVGPPAGNEPGSAPEGSPDELLERLEISASKIEPLVQQMISTTADALRYAEFIQGAPEELEVNAAQRVLLNDVMDFVTKVGSVIGVAKSTEPVGEDALKSLNMFARLANELIDDCENLRAVAEELRITAGQLEQHPFRGDASAGSASEAMRVANEIDAWSKRWGTPPAFEIDVFDDVKRLDDDSEDANAPFLPATPNVEPTEPSSPAVGESAQPAAG